MVGICLGPVLYDIPSWVSVVCPCVHTTPTPPVRDSRDSHPPERHGPVGLSLGGDE